MSGGCSKYETLLDSWRKLHNEVEESKNILDSKYEEQPSNEKQKIERRYALFIKKFNRICSLKDEALDDIAYSKEMRNLSKYSIKVKELFKYLCI